MGDFPFIFYFSNSSHLYRINSNNYIDDYNISSVDNLYIQSGNDKSMLYPYIKLHFEDKDKILNYIHKIYTNYKN